MTHNSGWLNCPTWSAKVGLEEITSVDRSKTTRISKSEMGSFRGAGGTRISCACKLPILASLRADSGWNAMHKI